jgi:hypothetical protein
LIMVDRNFLAGIVRVSLFGLMLAVGACDAIAALGQAPSTLPAVSAPRPASGARMSAAASTARSSLYALHETALENGTTVWEYATPAGQVFAVAWRGPVLPDLSALLGNYFRAFKVETEQIRAVGSRGAPITIERDGLVLQSGGRMRNFFGYAYVPALVPAGVNIKDVLQ